MTLVELLVVLAILGLVAALALPSFTLGEVSDPLVSSRDRVAQVVSAARQEALERATSIELVFDSATEGYRMGITGGSAASATLLGLPPGIVQLALLPGTRLRVRSRWHVMRFAPTGEVEGEAPSVSDGKRNVAVLIPR